MPVPGSNEPTAPLSQNATGSAPAVALPSRPSLAHLPTGAVVSRYRIESVLGEGGMGVVYLARQERPDREVALKVVRPGYATERMLKRFELEAEVLGRLLHPGIAQIYEAGVWTGPEREREGLPQTPFFAMELVRGVPLTKYAEGRKLSTRERLELVAKVCDAVQHAHQKGVIHRDLKPSNILVTELDAPSDRSTQHPARSTLGQPKILDFGVARATDSDIQQTTMETDVGAIIGTLPYMSPEQVGGDPAELDTRSDVYALGVIAYEMLVGRLPYDLERKMIHEAARIIREEEPTRLSSIDRALRGDVETIVAHALEKDKARRYGAASALAADIRRYLSDEPIAARPASTWYQVAKFSRRNTGLVAGVGAAFAVLITGLALSLYAFAQADHERSEKSKALAAEMERADQLKQVSEFQEGMLRQVNATEAGLRLTKDVNDRFAEALKKSGVPEDRRLARADAFRQEWLRVNATDAARTLIDETILKPAVRTIDQQFKNQPLVDAQLRQVLADRYRGLGMYDAAKPLQARALAIRRSVLSDEHPDTISSLNNMGGLLYDAGDLADAQPYFRDVLDTRRRISGEEHRDTLTSMNNMGSLLQARGKLAEAEPYFREALKKRRLVLGEMHPHTLGSINNMANWLLERGMLAEAEPYYLEALEKFRSVYGEDHPDTATSIISYCSLLEAQGRLVEALPLRREALEKFRRVLGEEHPRTLIAITGMGFLLQAQGKFVEAEPYFRQALESSRRILGDDHPDTLGCLNNMGFLYQALGKFAAAEPLYHEALEKRRRELGETHPDTLTSINNLGGLLVSQGRVAEAEPYLREVLAARRRVQGEDHPETLKSIRNLAFILHSQGKLADAETLFREVLERRRRTLGVEHPDTLVSLTNMGFVLRAGGRLAEAEPYYREAMVLRQQTLGEENPETLGSISTFASLLRAQGKHAEAIALLEPLEPKFRATFTDGDVVRLAGLLLTLGRARAGTAVELASFPIAESNLLEAHQILLVIRGESHTETRAAIQSLIELYTAWDKAEPGKNYDAKAATWKRTLDIESSAAPASK